MVISRSPTPYPYRRKMESNSLKEKNIMKEYCKDMFQRSMLTGVPQIVAAQSIRSKVFKTFVFLGSIFGFLYQTSAFLSIYFSYPTLVDVKVTTPPFVDVPSITICNRNGLRRSEYCMLKPQNCAPLKQLVTFCENHPEVCSLGRKYAETLSLDDCKLPRQLQTLASCLCCDLVWRKVVHVCFGHSEYPVPGVFDEERNVTQKTIQEIGHHSFPLISACTFLGANVYLDICKNQTFKSFVFQDIYGKMKMCYILNAKWSEPTLNLPRVPVRATLQITLDLEPEEYFRLDRDVAAQVAIHSPWTIHNPFKEGFIVEPRKAYILHYKEAIKNLLPWPYQTNCTDYIEAWNRRGGNGPLSKEMCVEECVLNQTMDNCKCALTTSLYPHKFNFCSSNTEYCIGSINYTHCFVKCSPACHSRHFEVSVKGEKIEEDPGAPELVKKGNKTAVILIIFKHSEVVIYTYRAKYESIELFSFLGGYVGIWLGISLIALLDFLESLASFMVFAIERMKESKGARAIRSAISRNTRVNSTDLDDVRSWAVPVRH